MISQSIAREGMTLVLALFWGMVLAFEYDCIRVFRRIVRHKRVWTMSAEDIIFWINTGFMVFSIIYELNNGIIRGFVTAGFVAGAVIYDIDTAISSKTIENMYKIYYNKI